jgi:hypothetical protein
LIDEVEGLHPEAQRALLAGATRLKSCIDRIVAKLEVPAAPALHTRVRESDRVAKAHAVVVPEPTVRAAG